MHIRSVKLVLVLFVVVICVGSSLSAWAQGAASTGTVAGTVTDASNAVVTGATVTLTDTATKSSRSIPTNGSGRYIL